MYVLNLDQLTEPVYNRLLYTDRQRGEMVFSKEPWMLMECRKTSGATESNFAPRQLHEKREHSCSVLLNEGVQKMLQEPKLTYVSRCLG